MVQLLKIKEQIYRFVGRFEIYVVALARFAVAFAAFTLINMNIGFMEELKEYPVALVFALLCSFLPSGMMMFLGMVMILAHFYALSVELCGIAALLFVILFCMYLRFSTRKGVYTVLTPVLATFGVPYVMPVAAGLLTQAYTAVSVVCGEVVFFLLKNVKENAALFSSSEEVGRRSLVTLAVNQIFTDKEMYLYLAAFAVATIVVFCVRRLSVDHARIIAIVLGIVIQMGIICSGEIYLGNTRVIIGVIIGCIVSLLILLVVDFLSMSLDYSRVEHTQFEDDEYYYYVKAVPKAFVPVEDKQVKKINAKRPKNRKVTKGKRVKAVHVSGDSGKRDDSLEAQVMREFRDSEEK